MPECPECRYAVIDFFPYEQLATRRAYVISDREVEVLKCPVSHFWHVVELGGVGQLEMWT